jgi:hypothetical protein
MSLAKFASLHGGLLARKGLATPATLPLPVMSQQPRPRYRDEPPPALDETCCGGASGGNAEKAPAVVTLRPVRSTNTPRVADYEAQQEINADLRTHVSVRLSPDQMRRLKTAAIQLHLSRQKIVADGLDVYLDKLAAEDLAGCRCLKAKN